MYSSYMVKREKESELILLNKPLVTIMMNPQSIIYGSPTSYLDKIIEVIDLVTGLVWLWLVW